MLVDAADRYTPTPAVSHAILRANGGRVAGSGLADGIVVTPSHNPPADGGFKYNPPHGGPADTDATGWIARRANELLAAGLAGVRRTPLATARQAAAPYDFVGTYVADLQPSSTSRRSGPPACTSAPIRSVGRASTTGRRSPTSTASTSPSSTPSSTRPGGS